MNKIELKLNMNMNMKINMDINKGVCINKNLIGYNIFTLILELHSVFVASTA